MDGLETVWDVRGLLSSPRSLGGSTVLDEIKRLSNDFGQMTREYQEHDGEVDGSTLHVDYAYADPAGATTPNTVRKTSITYPNATAITNHYGSGIPDALGRPSALKEGSTTLASYKSLGLGTDDAEVGNASAVNREKELLYGRSDRSKSMRAPAPHNAMLKGMRAFSSRLFSALALTALSVIMYFRTVWLMQWLFSPLIEHHPLDWALSVFVVVLGMGAVVHRILLRVIPLGRTLSWPIVVTWMLSPLLSHMLENFIIGGALLGVPSDRKENIVLHICEMLFVLIMLYPRTGQRCKLGRLSNV